MAEFVRRGPVGVQVCQRTIHVDVKLDLVAAAPGHAAEGHRRIRLVPVTALRDHEDAQSIERKASVNATNDAGGILQPAREHCSALFTDGCREVYVKRCTCGAGFEQARFGPCRIGRQQQEQQCEQSIAENLRCPGKRFGPRSGSQVHRRPGVQEFILAPQYSNVCPDMTMRALLRARREIGMQGGREEGGDKLNTDWVRSEPGEFAPENRDLLNHIEDLIRDDACDDVLGIIAGWEPADVRDLMIYLPIKYARRLYARLPTELALAVLARVSPDLRSNLVDHGDIARLAEIAVGLHEDDAVELLDDLPSPVVGQVLEQLPDGADLRERLEFERDTAGEAMTSKFVAVHVDWNVRMATRAVRKMAAEIESFYEVYVVNEERQLVGRLQLRDLLLNKKRTRIRDIMREVLVFVHPDADQEDVLELARMYDVQTIPVVDEGHHVIGRITVEELQEIVRDEAEEDIMLMSGLAPDALPDDSVRRIIRGRLPWLMGGLVGAALAGAVVGSFEAQLEQAAILASFIPVVMAMAGNAGIQASTVTVQGLAAGNLWIGDLGGRVAKELLGSLINGALIAVILGLIVMLIAKFVPFEEPLRLAMAAGLSVLLVIMIAATLGSTIPLVLNHLNIDPAVATGVFITTANDILGVLVYFTVASTIYLSAVA